MSLPNVVGLGVRNEGDESTGPVVAVYVSRKIPPEQLSPEAMVPKNLELDEGILVPTRVIESGQIDLEV